MSNSAITFHNLGVVQAPGALAVPIFAHTRQSPPTLAAAPCARLRERGSTLCLCNTDHPAGPRIRKQDPWELEGHGQYVPPRLPPPQASISRMLRMAYRMLRYCIRRRSAISYVLGDVNQQHQSPYVLYRIIPMLQNRMRHRQKTYDIVCDVVRQNGKNL